MSKEDERFSINVPHGISRTKGPAIKRGSDTSVVVIIEEDKESGLPNFAKIQPNEQKNISFDIDVLPKRPTPGVFGAVFFAKPFHVLRWNTSEQRFLPMEPTFGVETEYPQIYFRSSKAKVVIKITIYPTVEANIKYLNSSLIRAYLTEGYTQMKIFNGVYGPRARRFDVPLSPAFPYLQFGTILNHLPPKGTDGEKFLHFRIIETLGEYFFQMYESGRSPYELPRKVAAEVGSPESLRVITKKEMKSSLRKRFVQLFKNNYATLTNKYRMGMLVTEYSGKPLYSLFLRDIFLNSPKGEDFSKMRKILLPLFFQLIHIRVVLNKLGVIHMDLKTDNILAIPLKEASEQNVYHTKTDNGEIKAPLFVLEVPHSTFANINEDKIVVNPYKTIEKDDLLDEDYVYIAKLIDFGSSVDKRKTIFETEQQITPERDIFKRSSETYAYSFRPPESFIEKREGHVYHLSDTFAMGILLLQLTIGTSVSILASVSSWKSNWSISYRNQWFVNDWKDVSKSNGKGYMLLHYFARHLLFVCLEDMKKSSKLFDEKKYESLKKMDKEDYNRFFMVEGVDFATYINWEDGGVMTKEQLEKLMGSLEGSGKEFLEKYDLEVSESNRQHMLEHVKSAHLYFNKAKGRIKAILGEQGIYMLLKMLHFDARRRPWSKEILVEQLSSYGIFKYMVEDKDKYYERLRMLGTKGVSRYNLGLYSVSLDIARPYSQSKLSGEEPMEIYSL